MILGRKRGGFILRLGLDPAPRMGRVPTRGVEDSNSAWEGVDANLENIRDGMCFRLPGLASYSVQVGIGNTFCTWLDDS